MPARLRAAAVRCGRTRTKCAAMTVSVSLFSSAIASRHQVQLAASRIQRARLSPGTSGCRSLPVYSERKESPHRGQLRNANSSREWPLNLSRSPEQRRSHNRSHDKASRTAGRVIPIARANRHVVRSHGTRIHAVRIHAVRIHGTRIHGSRIHAVRNVIGRDGLFAVR